MSHAWPERLWLVRHGESTGNVANAQAYSTGAEQLDLDLADPEVPLTELGRRQARALGQRLAEELPAGPDLCLASTYRRTRQTAREVLAAAGWDDVPLRLDERLRDREQGILDRLTQRGIKARFPEEARRRAALGKFYYRPPGGESWADVALRIRSLLQDLRVDHTGQRVLLVTHDVPILVTRYVVEGLSVDDAVRLSGQVPNCGLTEYRPDRPGGLCLERFADVTPVDEDADTPVTAHGERP
jgi:probable phosphoglycerate mutase